MPLTIEQVEQAKDQLRVIKTLERLANDRVEHTRTQAFEELPQVDQLAYMTMTKGLLDALEELVNELDDLMGISPNSEDVVGELAQVIGLFDGNRRQGNR